MFNRFPARCIECGKLVAPGQGIVLWETGTHKKPVWKVKCNSHIDWRQFKKYYRPKEYKDLDGN